MKIYTYYVQVPELNSFDELKLLSLWRRRWFEAGFEPETLGEYQAQQHSMFAKYDQAITQLPSCNPSSYERACWLRWLALAQVGGGFMSDYDVFPYPDGDGQPGIGMSSQSKVKDKVVMLQERAPSLCWADQAACERLCMEFSTLKYGNRPQDGKPHFSDQYAIEDLVGAKTDWIELRNEVKGYMDEGWENALFVHYSTASMARRNNLPRWRHIPGLRSK